MLATSRSAGRARPDRRAIPSCISATLDPFAGMQENRHADRAEAVIEIEAKLLELYRDPN